MEKVVNGLGYLATYFLFRNEKYEFVQKRSTADLSHVMRKWHESLELHEELPEF